MNITEMLDQLADYRAAADALRLRKEDEINAVLSDEQRARIAEIDAEYAGMQERVDEQAAELEGQIKDVIIASGQTVRGARLQAVYVKGRVTWDSRELEGMMALIPQIREARREGKPSVTIRAIG